MKKVEVGRMKKLVHLQSRKHLRALCRAMVMGVAFALVTAAAPLSASQLYFDGFEPEPISWFNAMRVSSGTNGITSASGSYHAVVAGSSFTRWGGYNFGAGDGADTTFQEYWTSVNIYLNVGGGWANDTRFDFSSAICDSTGIHRRDFVFSGGFYNDAVAPGAGDRFVFSASNNTPGWPKNPGKDPFVISATGWYTFEHHFYDNSGVLAVDLEIFDSSNASIHTWTLSDPTDLIAGIGGNRYGWFVDNGFSVLAFDNTELRTADETVPEPATMLLLGLGLVGLAGIGRKLKK